MAEPKPQDAVQSGPKPSPAKGARSRTPTPRGPNAKRREATRKKLLEATIECLYRYGYFGTSTVLVTEVAGVSRGSLLHQFPTKVDLMIATAEHIRLHRREVHYRIIGAMKDEEEKFRALTGVTWGEMAKPSGIARIELMLAARSDPEFAARMQPLNEVFELGVRDSVWGLVERLGVKNRAKADTLTRLYVAALRGLTIDGLFDKSREHIPEVVELLQKFMNGYLKELQDEGAKDA